MKKEPYVMTDVSQDEFEDLVQNSTKKELHSQLRKLSKVKGTKWEQKYIRKELISRRGEPDFL